jgi:hypothetical protein
MKILPLLTRKLTENEHDTAPDPVTALAALIDSAFPDLLPEEKDPKLIAAVAPDAVRALRQLRRERILEAASKLPLRQLVDGITAAADALRSELKKVADMSQRIEAMKAEEIRLENAASADPLVAARIHGEIQSLETWIAKSAPLQNAVETLCHSITEAGRHLSTLTTHQPYRSQLLRRIGDYSPFHLSITCKPLLERATMTLEVADRALAQISALEHGNVPGLRSESGMVTLIGVTFRLPDE